MEKVPDKETHLEQYQHNKDFLENGISDTNKFADWAVTVTFYCAVHIVEAALANINIHSDNHCDRGKKIKNLNCPRLKTYYKDLYSRSITSRYNCIIQTSKDIEGAMKDLKEIQKAVGIK